MTIVAGVDCMPLNVRASVFDSERGRRATAVAAYNKLYWLYRNVYLCAQPTELEQHTAAIFAAGTAVHFVTSPHRMIRK